ncbi:hypothetical protein C8Q73DRAFT_666029 [Cubamyces lactineus]|nr:hypothetical protein C8Q73DRAFT_666029 [Cubamyces lactineus]
MYALLRTALCQRLTTLHDLAQVAKTPAFSSLTIAQVVTDFGASQFTRCLHDFLVKLATGDPARLNVIGAPLQHTSRVAAYKQCKVRLPVARQVTSHTLIDSIHASPARASSGLLKPPIPAKMSTVLARDPAIAVSSPAFAFDPSQPLRGLRVARVRIIFELPRVYNAKSLGVTEPLAYVEWFTPFHVYDEITGMRIDRRPVQGDVLDSHTTKFYRYSETYLNYPGYSSTRNGYVRYGASIIRPIAMWKLLFPDVSRLPKTIVDAVQITYALGIRYLWVDSLCIIQDSREDQNKELARMRNVYRQAFLVIDAASAINASQGFLYDSGRLQMDASTWLPFDWSRRHKGNPRRFTELLDIAPKADLTSRNPGEPLQALVIQSRGHTGERAWCLQETLMSGRRLRFAETLQFRCRQSLQRRAGNAFNHKFYGATTTPDIVFRPQAATLLSPYSADWITVHAVWSEVVEDYTLRSLSKPEDTLVACAGVAEAFGRALGSQSEYLAGLWRDSLIFDLPWTVTSPFRGIRDCRDTLAPSWSWAATCHPVSSMPWLMYRNNPAAPLHGWEELGEVVECAVMLENRALPFGRVTDGRLILRVTLLGPYKAEVLHSQLHDYLLLDEGYDPDNPQCAQQNLWLTPLLYVSFSGHTSWVVHCLVLYLEAVQPNVQPVAASSPLEDRCLEGVYRRVGGCTFDSRESEGREMLGQLQVISLRTKVDGRWTFPRKDIELI